MEVVIKIEVKDNNVEQAFETIAELNIKEEKPLLLRKEWIVNEKEEQN